MVLAQGEVRDPQLTGSMLTFQIANIVGIMERLTIPRRLWQPFCNYTFGCPSCGVNIANSPYAIQATVQGGSDKSDILLPPSVWDQAGNPADMQEFWAGGYILLETGPVATQARPIRQIAMQDGYVQVSVRYPFLGPPAVGDLALLRRGCRKTKADCTARGNLPNFGGFPDVPPPKLHPVQIEDPTT